MSIERKLATMGLVLPPPPSPAGAYVRAKRTGNLVFVSGQLPLEQGTMRYRGKVGKDLSVEQGYEAAKLCALNALSVLNAEIGSLERLAQLVRVTGFVCSAQGFVDQAQVVNGASEFLSEILGEKGSHARMAIGVSELPLGAAVELEVIAEVS